MGSQARLFPVTNCRHCPNIKVLRGPGGDSSDYVCSAVPGHVGERHAEVGRIVAGYVESFREGPQEGVFPRFCPLVPAPRLKTSVQKRASKPDNCACNETEPSIGCEARGLWHAGDPLSRIKDIKEGKPIAVRLINVKDHPSLVLK